MRAAAGAALIPDCEIPSVLVALCLRFLGKARALGDFAGVTAIAGTTLMNAVAVKQRSEHEGGDNEEFYASAKEAHLALALAGINGLAAIEGTTVVEAAASVMKAATAATAKTGNDPVLAANELDLVNNNQPGLIEVLFLSIPNPEEKLAEIQARIDAGEEGIDYLVTGLQATIDTRRVAAGLDVEGKDGDDFGKNDVVSKDQFMALTGALGNPVAEAEPLNEADFDQLLLDLNELPTTDDPHDKTDDTK